MRVFINADYYYHILINSDSKRFDRKEPVEWGTICFELDEEMGLELIGEDTNEYSFHVTDEKKWMLAKIKWGL
jgi:hypothetical protein